MKTRKHSSKDRNELINLQKTVFPNPDPHNKVSIQLVSPAGQEVLNVTSKSPDPSSISRACCDES